MKTFGLLLLMTFTFSMCGYSQVTFGGKIGFNLANIKGNGMAGGLKAGFEGGAFSEITFNSKWGLQPELIFSLRNAKRGDDFDKYYVNDASLQTNTSIQQGYLSIPVLLRYKLNDLLSFNFGPQVGFQVYNQDELLKYNNKAFKKWDAGLAAGVQLNLSSFKVYARYQYGMLNVNNIDDRYKWHPSQISIGIGVALFQTKK